MIRLNCTKINNINNEKCKPTNFKGVDKTSIDEDKKMPTSFIDPAYYRAVNGIDKKKVNGYMLMDLGIPNLHFIDDTHVRGESLLTKKNYKLLNNVKQAGIERVVDLKTADHKDTSKDKLDALGIEYIHFPVDSGGMSDREIIDNMPKMFEAFDKGNVYISCAQGLHRTDIALSLNYFFNKNAQDNPPILYGHIRKNDVRIDDIFKRVNSVYKNLTDEDKEKLGIEDLDADKLRDMKIKLLQANNEYPFRGFLNTNK